MHSALRRFSRPSPRLLLVLLVAVAALGSAPHAARATEPLEVLLLDYHAPIEHDVLQSHLCVEPCTRSRGCPKEWIAEGVDAFSADFKVFRPQYLGRSARFVVSAYGDHQLDLVSLSGHHASGFSGERGRGSFVTERLATELEGVAEVDGFFAAPSMVMLQGCWTDVKSGFDGDPVEYIRHIIEDTQVRAGESERLLAAIRQMAGHEDAYRDLFPNACILGYDGTQVPGGLLEIYGQVHGVLRGLHDLQTGTTPPPKFDLAAARRSRQTLDETNRAIDRECLPSGWPCNLCAKDSAVYRPLANALATHLRAERARQVDRAEPRRTDVALATERRLEDASLYINSSWSCSTVAPSTPPVFPRPIDRAPFVELFVDLLTVDLGQLTGDTRQRLEAELVHLLGSTTLTDDVRTRLHARLTGDLADWRRTFIASDLQQMSTFRQRDFFDFLAEIGCSNCFVEVLDPERPRILRENAASQLRPSLGRALYARALDDPSSRVRLLAASRLEPSLGRELYERAASDESERVRAAVPNLPNLDLSGR